MPLVSVGQQKMAPPGWISPDRQRHARRQIQGRRNDNQTRRLKTPSPTFDNNSTQGATYSVENWLRTDGDQRDVDELPARSAFACDPLGCICRVKRNTVALIREAGALEEDCRSTDIVIAPFPLEEGCNAASIVVDRRALKRSGAHALYIEGLSIRTETVAKMRGARPWARRPARPSPETLNRANRGTD